MTGKFGASTETLGTGIHVVAVSGPVDLYGARDLKSRLIAAVEAAQTGVVIDLTETTFIDSSGLATLVAAHRRARLLGCEVVLANTDPGIARTLKITGLDIILPVLGDRDAAIERLSG